MGISGYAILIHATLAFFGGCVREVDLAGKKGFSVFQFVSGAFVSTFGGVVTFFICMSYNVSPWLTAALTSLAGYVGIPILDFFIVAFKKKLEGLIGSGE